MVPFSEKRGEDVDPSDRIVIRVPRTIDRGDIVLL